MLCVVVSRNRDGRLSTSTPRPRPRRAPATTGSQQVDWIAVGKRLAAVRQALGMSADQFCKKFNVSRGWLSDVENGNKHLDRHDLGWLDGELQLPPDFLRDGHPTLTQASPEGVDQLIGRLRKLILLYGQPALEQAKQFVSQLEEFVVLYYQLGPSATDGPIHEILSKWAGAVSVERESALWKLSITPVTAHQIYATLLRSATGPGPVRCTSAVDPQWWTEEEGLDYHHLNVWKAEREQVQIERLLILQSEEFRIRSSSNDSTKAFAARIVGPQARAGVVVKQILSGALPENARRDMMIIGDRYAAWSDLARGEPKMVYLSDARGYVLQSACDFDDAWSSAEPVPDLNPDGSTAS